MDDRRSTSDGRQHSPEKRDQVLSRLITLGIALSAERDHNRLTETILIEAKNLTGADGGTLYLMSDDRTHLSFHIIRNDTLKIAMGGTTGAAIPFPALALHDPNTGAPNHHNVATYVALTGKGIVIQDAYTEQGFDFSGTRRFDAGTGYRSKTFLTVPLKNISGDVIGVLQLINARDASGTIIPFSEDIQPLVDSLASQAAVAIDNQSLLQGRKNLLDSFVTVIARAIDAKSPYTGGHCERVPVLAEMLAKAACEAAEGPLATFDLDDDEWYELHIAGWLHDCGKVTTPEYVVDKATKLETITDRIHEVRTRFEVLRRDAEIAMLRSCLDEGVPRPKAEIAFTKRCSELEKQFEIVAQSNIGSEFMDPATAEKLREIGQQTFTRYFDRTLGLSWEERDRLGEKERQHPPVLETLLQDREDHYVNIYNRGEAYCLTVPRGTLTPEERQVINDHIVVTQDMLEKLPFPPQMRRVPAIAGNHHEKIDGTGYPRGLRGEQMGVTEKIMAIADVFEALTAADRPYKTAKKIGECLRILQSMTQTGHLDTDLFVLFLQSGVHREYAKRFLHPDQWEEIDIAHYMPKA